MPFILALAISPAVLASFDSFVRALLVVLSRRKARARTDGQPRRWLVVIPARAEGARLRETIESVRAAARGHDVTTLLLLDGDDREAAAIAAVPRPLGPSGARGTVRTEEPRNRGTEEPFHIQVVIKEPPGPSKAAALAWLVREHRATIEACDAILLLDAGSRVAPDFFEHFDWPEGADAVQSYLAGSGTGVGAAAAASETFAQANEDRGRERLGWNARLRGTGSAFRPQTFASVVPRLVTRIEDSEASLLITADGGVIRMSDARAIVFDDKPNSVSSAAAQRARWLLGRYELLIRRFGTFVAIVARRPAEGLALFVEIFGRPLSLTVPLRIGAAAIAYAYDQKTLAAILAGSTLIDVAVHIGASGGVPRGSLRFAASWFYALFLLPRAVTRWLRVER